MCDLCVVNQAAVALGMEPDMARALDAAQENSFLARLSLLDPGTLDAAVAEKIADLLDAAVAPGAAGAGASTGDDVAVTAIHDLLRQLVYVDPNANMLANGLRPLWSGPRLSLHSSRVTALQFPLYVRGEDDSVVSSRGKMALRDMATGSNPFFDGGVLKYYEKAGGAAPPTPWSSRKVLAAAVWFDFHPQQYVAGVLEEDDPSHAAHGMIGKAVGAGRSFTLYLYDREKHHVSGSCVGG